MKNRILCALPTVFSLRNDAGYDQLLARTGAEQMMRASWERVGHGLGAAIAKMDREVAKDRSQPQHAVAPLPALSSIPSQPKNRMRASEQKKILANIRWRILPGSGPVSERLIGDAHGQTTTYDGPIPHPAIFRAYGDVLPGAPERILKVFEDDSKHTRDLQMTVLNLQRADHRRIHWMAWSLIAGGYAMSIAFALMDKDALAGIVLTTTIIGTVTGFLQARSHVGEKE